MTEDAAVVMRDLSFAYGGAAVLEVPDLDIARGDFVSIVGPNGGGKTTLLKLMLGILTPVRGWVRIFGAPPAQARRRIGYMPQVVHHDPQFPATVLDVVLMGRLGLQRGGAYKAADREAARAALEEVGLVRRASTPLAELSGGQRQRALIARALCGEPDLLLLDEPTSHVDSRSTEMLFAILQRLNRRMTILLVSHDIGVVARVVKTVLCVNRSVTKHPASGLTGENLRDIYATDICLVRHDQGPAAGERR